MTPLTRFMMNIIVSDIVIALSGAAIYSMQLYQINDYDMRGGVFKMQCRVSFLVT